MKTDPVFIIAEAGVNHNGSLRLAKKMVDVACGAGADAVKFQSFHAEEIATANAPKAKYQLKNISGGSGQLGMLKGLELSEVEQRALFFYCKKKKIEFLSTPFDLKSLSFLIKLGVRHLKISSGEITNGPLLLAAARSGLPLFLSTGMSGLSEIRDALDVISFGYLTPGSEQPSLLKMRCLRQTAAAKLKVQKHVTLLQCTTEYPAPICEVNLKVMDTLRSQFGCRVGLSDHTQGIEVALAAAARGANVVEKHFTLDKKMKGPDHQASLEPVELQAMIKGVRKIEQALGSSAKKVTASERQNRSVVRRSIVAAKKIRRGEIFSEINLAVKRACAGLSPMLFWRLLGKRAKRNYKKEERISR